MAANHTSVITVNRFKFINENGVHYRQVCLLKRESFFEWEKLQKTMIQKHFLASKASPEERLLVKKFSLETTSDQCGRLFFFNSKFKSCTFRWC